MLLVGTQLALEVSARCNDEKTYISFHAVIGWSFPVCERSKVLSDRGAEGDDLSRVWL